MGDQLSLALREYLDTSPAFAVVATLLPSGVPHLTKVWVTRDGEDLIFATALDRLQGRNAERDPRVTLLIEAPGNPYAYAEVRGRARLEPDPGRVVADALCRAHTGKSLAEFNPGSAESEFVVVRVGVGRVTGRF
ncbi:PPOX class F420-dependent oxidoreductase [Streptomyces sp. NPDC087440]|uniref:PPOX class F420-dependent oxidoreductase n=1 Tax=Streptomyces sp. NPDC087440 TaxID=3365790 RepID=UPI00382F20AE